MTTLAGHKIHRYRLAQHPKMTRADFGAVVGGVIGTDVPGGTINGWERDGKVATPEKANAIARLGIASHADWYRPASCPQCKIDSDDDRADLCREAGCPLAQQQVA